MDGLEFFYGVVSILAIPVNLVHFVVWSTLDFLAFDLLNLPSPLFG
jgi:hypothetical protein